MKVTFFSNALSHLIVWDGTGYMYSKSPFQVGVETVCTPSLLSRLRSGGAETETQ